MYVYVCVCVCIYIYVYIHGYIYTWFYRCLYTIVIDFCPCDANRDANHEKSLVPTSLYPAYAAGPAHRKPQPVYPSCELRPLGGEWCSMAMLNHQRGIMVITCDNPHKLWYSMIHNPQKILLVTRQCQLLSSHGSPCAQLIMCGIDPEMGG
jgi:hypothetical protein